MKTKKITITKYVLASIICLLATMQTSFGQGVKKSSGTTSVAKPGAKEGKGIVKSTISADMDCSVKINGAAKLITLKANTPIPTVLKPGANTIEAVTMDKKSTFKSTVMAQPGETKLVEVSFLTDNKFLEYIKQGNIEMVEAAIKRNPALATNNGEILIFSPIEIAIENSQLDIIKLLVSKGASLTSSSAIFPLHKAILSASSEKTDKDKPAPDRELVDYFLSNGFQITDRDSNGNTPLHCAAQAGKLELIVYLIEKGADINAKNNSDNTPLKIAEDNGGVSIISYLKPKQLNN